MALNREKFQQAVLYFLHQSNPAVMGRVKLMKLLYYLDFDHLERYRRSVTGDKYIHLQHGPVPRSANDIIDAMEGSMLRVEQTDIGLENPIHAFTPLAPYNLDVFTDTERDVLMSVAERWRDATGTQIEYASHQEEPWLSTTMYQEVPKITAFHRRRSERPSPDLRESMFESILASMSKEGIVVPEDEARQLFAEVEAEVWNEGASPQ